MPELAEVEVVRRGLASWVVGARIDQVDVLHPRPVRRHVAGADDLAARLRGVRFTDVVRRGKFLWLTLDPETTERPTGLVVHLGMSGQVLLQPAEAPAERHLRVRFSLSGTTGEAQGRELRFVDQRMFGGLWLADLVPTPDGLPGGAGGPDGLSAQPLIPTDAAHIARDVLDPHLDTDLVISRMRARRSGIKRGLLDQALISGIGNIYADEALWASKLHYDRPMDRLAKAELRTLLANTSEVMQRALAQGGTSFDSLYVNVNGESGYFERELQVYGREGRPCRRCGAVIRRESFMNRSSFRCPVCQRPAR